MLPDVVRQQPFDHVGCVLEGAVDVRVESCFRVFCQEGSKSVYFCLANLQRSTQRNVPNCGLFHDSLLLHRAMFPLFGPWKHNWWCRLGRRWYASSIRLHQGGHTRRCRLNRCRLVGRVGGPCGHLRASIAPCARGLGGWMCRPCRR
jgi:hypothetical protein